MNQGTHFSGQPILAQVMKMIPREEVRRIAAQFKSDRYYKRFKTYDHLVAMLYTMFNHCTSLREVVTGLLACEKRLSHVGVSYTPRRSTLADANGKRDSAVFEAIYRSLYALYAPHLPDSRKKKRQDWTSRLFIMDSTTISLFQEILKGTGQAPIKGKRKGGVKAHTLIKAEENVPAFVDLTAGSKADRTFMKLVELPPGSIITFDRGYVNYAIYAAWSAARITFVTRMRSNAAYEELESLPVSERQKKAGVLSDTVIMLGHTHTKKVTRIKARLVEYHDAKSDRTFSFLTNNFRMAPATIAAVYQKRWEIEVLFKRIKQNNPLRYFLGDNENAIKIQIWCALISDLLLMTIRRQTKRKWSFANLASMVRLHLMTYIDLRGFLEDPEKALLQRNRSQDNARLLSLFPT